MMMIMVMIYCGNDDNVDDVDDGDVDDNDDG